MNTHVDKTQENKSQAGANTTFQKQSSGESTFQFVDNRSEAVAQKKLQAMANNSPQAKQLRAFQEMANINSQAKPTVQLLNSKDFNVIQMNRVDSLEESGKDLGEIVNSMRERATGAAVNMLWDFDEMQEGYRYFVATNEQEGDLERFGLMSLKNPATVKEGENEVPINPMIDESIWVEGLVADPDGRGLGGLLLEKAEQIASEEEKRTVALAAYEYDPRDQGEEGDPYAVAGYYEERKGYSYSGEAYEEVDDEGRSHFYPIYHKAVQRKQQEMESNNSDENIAQKKDTDVKNYVLEQEMGSSLL